MRIFFKILSVMFVSSSCSLSVIGCNKCTTDTNNDGSKPPDNKPIIYNVSFKEILHIDGDNFFFDSLSRYFVVYEKDVLGASNLPSKMWVTDDITGDKIAYFYVKSDTLWDKIALVYGFNRNSTPNEIVDLMYKNSIVNVSMSIRLNSIGTWNLLDFQVK